MPEDGALVRAAEPKPLLARRATDRFTPMKAGNLVVRYTADPPTIHVDTVTGSPFRSSRSTPRTQPG